MRACATHVNLVQRLYPTLKVYQKKKKLATFNLLARAPPSAAAGAGAFATLAAAAAAAGCASGGTAEDTAGLAPPVATIRARATLIALLPLLLRDTLLLFPPPPSHRWCCLQRPTRDRLANPVVVEKLDTLTHRSAYVAKTRKEHLLLLLLPPAVILWWLRIPPHPPATVVGKPDIIPLYAGLCRWSTQKQYSSRRRKIEKLHYMQHLIMPGIRRQYRRLSAANPVIGDDDAKHHVRAPHCPAPHTPPTHTTPMQAFVIENAVDGEGGEKAIGVLKTDEAVPVPKPGEALVRVLRAGVCNTDLELLAG